MRNIAKFMIGFTLLALPLFGWGCTEDIPTPSVSEKSDAAQTDANEPAPNGDEKPAAKPSGKDDVTAPSQQSSLPEGWKWYESDKYKVKFGYPSGWYLAESVGADGFYVFLADKEIQMAPEPMTPITIQLTSESLGDARVELLKQDPNLVTDAVEINGNMIERIRYQSEVLGATEYVYGLKEAFLWHIDDSAIQQVAMKILSVYTQGEAP